MRRIAVFAHCRKRTLNMDEKDLLGAKLELDLDDLFKDDQEASPPLAKEKELELTAAMSKRINEVRAKTEAEVRDKIAKELGFETYDAMQKAKHKKEIADAGYDPDDLEKVIEPLLEKRLASDPRMLKLQQIEEQEKKTYISNQLAEIEKVTGLKLTEADLSPETVELWQKGVELSKAYIATNSAKILAANTKGSTAHLSSGTGTGGTKLRGLTQAEKDLYRAINPYATEEELNKKTLEVK